MQIVFSEKCPDVGTFARICWTGVWGAAWVGRSETVLKPRDCGLQMAFFSAPMLTHFLYAPLQ